MRNLIAFCLLLLVSACASTGMYSAPNGDDVAIIKIESQMDASVESEAQGGWVTPGASTALKVGLFTIDGERLDETGGDKYVSVSEGKHKVQIFADGGGALRFKKFSLTVKAGGEYLVRVKRGSEAAAGFKAEVFDMAAPDTVMKEVAF